MYSLLDDDFYRLMFDNNPDAVLLMSPDGIVYKANPAACQMFLATEDELCRLGCTGISDTNDHRLYQTIDLLKKNKTVRGELCMLKGDGSRFPAELASRIFIDIRGQSMAVTTIRDITELKQAVEDLRGLQKETEHLATYDYLTGIFNRRAFVKKLKQEMSRTHRDRMPMSLILMDIDGFKEINDSIGHLAGDAVLKKVALSISEKLRSYDVLGRFGGDEFILCLPNTACSEAHIIAERLRDGVENTGILYDNQKISVTASVGVASHYHTEYESMEDLIAKVDLNLYEAKRQKNRVYVEN